MQSSAPTTGFDPPALLLSWLFVDIVAMHRFVYRCRAVERLKEHVATFTTKQ
jgi:hypothetical protein